MLYWQYLFSRCNSDCISALYRPSENWSTFSFKVPPPPASLPLPHPLSICVFLPSCPREMGEKTKHKMKIKGFKWPKRTHPLVSIQINSGSFHRLFVELFVLSRSGLIESISVLSSFLKRRNIYRNKYIIPCICYSPGPLLWNGRFWCNVIRPKSAVLVHTTLTII